jgi:hypothetical protein
LTVQTIENAYTPCFPRERQQNQLLSKNASVGIQQLSNKHLRTGMDFDEQKICACALCRPHELKRRDGQLEPDAAADR